MASILFSMYTVYVNLFITSSSRVICSYRDSDSYRLGQITRPLTELTPMNRGLKAQLKVFIVAISIVMPKYSRYVFLAGFFSIYNRSRDGCSIYKISTKGG